MPLTPTDSQCPVAEAVVGSGGCSASLLLTICGLAVIRKSRPTALLPHPAWSGLLESPGSTQTLCPTPLTLHRLHWEAYLHRQEQVLSGPRASFHIVIPMYHGHAQHLSPPRGPTVESEPSAFLWWVLGPYPSLGRSHLSPRAASLGWRSEKERAVALGQWIPSGGPRFPPHFLGQLPLYARAHPQVLVLRDALLLGFEVLDEK